MTSLHLILNMTKLSEKDRLSSTCGAYGTPNRIVKWLHMLTAVNRIQVLEARTFGLNGRDSLRL
jgi:hypothetical protein